MIIQVLVTLFILSVIALVRKHYIAPKKKIELYRKEFQKKGYRVYQFPYKIFTYPIIQTIYKDSEKGDAFYTYKNIFVHYDVVIGNHLEKPSISLFHPQLRLQFAQLERDFVMEKLKAITSQQARFTGYGLAFSEGQDWKRKRRIMSSLFTHDLIKESVSDIVQICESTFQSIQQNSLKIEDGKTFQYDIGKMANDIFSQVIITVFLGLKSYEQKIDGMRIGRYVVQLANDANFQAKGVLPMIFGVKFLDWGLTKEHREVNRRIKKFQSWLNNFIDHEMKNPEEKREQNQNQKANFRKNVLSLHLNQQNNKLNKYNREQLLSEIKTFVIAGTDTTSNFFRMAIYYIAQNPTIEQKLRDQIKQVFKDNQISFDLLKNMKYLEAIQKQTLRMYGPANFNFPRRVTKDFYLLGIPICKETVIQYHSMPTHYNPQYYENPFQFNPDRWLNQTEDKSTALLVSFGLGPRTCIGQQLALLQSKIALVLFYLRYQKVEVLVKQLQLKWKFLYKHDNMMVKISHK